MLNVHVERAWPLVQYPSSRAALSMSTHIIKGSGTCMYLYVPGVYSVKSLTTSSALVDHFPDTLCTFLLSMSRHEIYD